MPPQSLVDLSQLDLTQVAYDSKALDLYVPQQHEMRQLHGVHIIDPEKGFAVGYRDVSADEFWCRGHFPGFPVFPGVLLVESIAQLCVFYWRLVLGREQAPGRSMLFGGIDGVKFRDAITPGQRVTLVVTTQELKIRRSKYQTQAFVDDKLVFSGQITGLLGPEASQIYLDGK